MYDLPVELENTWTVDPRINTVNIDQMFKAPLSA